MDVQEERIRLIEAARQWAVDHILEYEIREELTSTDAFMAGAEWGQQEERDRVEAEVEALREALNWCLEEGGWRLLYYAPLPFPIAIEPGGTTSAGRARTSDELAAALREVKP